jgi:hypothetical protein
LAVALAGLRFGVVMAMLSRPATQANHLQAERNRGRTKGRGKNMSHDASAVRNQIQHIPQVMRSWFEIEAGIGDAPDERTLVVEVGFDLDPAGLHFHQETVDAIKATAKTVSDEGGTIFSRLRIVSS